jgi:hypothetical protein
MDKELQSETLYLSSVLKLKSSGKRCRVKELFLVLVRLLDLEHKSFDETHRVTPRETRIFSSTS